MGETEERKKKGGLGGTGERKSKEKRKDLFTPTSETFEAMGSSMVDVKYGG